MIQNKLVKYGLWIFFSMPLVGLIGYIVLINAFNIFHSPSKKVLAHMCDNEGRRQVTVFRLDGNAVTNPSIHVSINLCCNNSAKEEELIFTADNSSIKDDEVKINWATFDSLRIEYKSRLRIIIQRDEITFSDSTLNLHLIYNKVN